MKKLITVIFIILIASGFRARADEGMWLLPLIEKLNIGRMTELGLKLSAEDIYSLNKASIKDAIVLIPGCTGEIVSSQGLMLTNHHCGYGSIQAFSSVGQNYLKDGYWAKSKDQELPNPGMYAGFLISIEDVTDQVLADVKPGMTESERNSAINLASLKIEKENGKGPDYRTTVSSFYGGNYFYLIIYEMYTDVRFVGAPPSSVGKFGADTDNWEWPRHTGDFSVLRVYTGPDGKPAPYSKENIPLKPRHWLPVSLKDLNKDDFAMILGFPGRTKRYYTSFEVNEIININDPNMVKIRGIRQDILLADMLADEKVNIQYATKYYQESTNYYKYAIGEKRGLERLNIVAEKLKLEEQFNKWVASDPASKEKYGEALNLIKSSIEGRAEFQNAYSYINECFNQGCELLQLNQEAVSLVFALKSGDKQNVTEVSKNIKDDIGSFYKDYNPPTDKKSIKAMLKLYRDDVPAKFHPDFYTNIIDKKFKGNIDKFVDDMFARSVFADEKRLMAFLDKPVVKTLETDPVYLIGNSVNKMESEVLKNRSRYSSTLAEGQRLWIAGLMEMEPEKTWYPDANRSERLTYGTVRDYDPKDGVTYKYYTTLQGVIDKYKPADYEFDLPQRLIDLNNKKEFGRYASSEGYMPVCFLTTNDITGGNSGSPVINANGELIGIAFDGNWEAMSGDVAYETALQRCINVDIRYVLWIMDIYAGAKNLVDEMTIVQ